MSILDKHNIPQSIYSSTLIPKKSNVRQAKFRILHIDLRNLDTVTTGSTKKNIHVGHIADIVDSGQTALQG